MDDLLRDFLTESTENLLRLDQEIVELEKTPDDPELLKSIFRTIHTIKGTCGFLDLARLERVAHAAENVLGLLRDGARPVTSPIITDVLAAVDVIRSILEGLEGTETEPAGDDSALIARLDRWMEGHEAEEVDLEGIHFPVPVFAPRPAAETTEPAPEPEPEAKPVAKKRSRAAKSGKAPRKAGKAAAAAPAAAEPSAPARPAAQPAAAAQPAGDGERAERVGVAESSLRVGVEILDQLMNLAGELVLTRNQLVQLAQEDQQSRYVMPLQHLNRVTSDLQEAVMKTRMQPIGGVWAKLPRMVRDLAQASGKKIELEMVGAETELDRQILQAIQDPLTHMIRNSADHGIEAPEARRAVGKRESGTIRLEAFHEGGQIIIEIRDDGRGLDVEAIRAKAVHQGLVSADAAASLSESQVFRFIFEPGFSTAEKITNVSGRGVGMDVVRSNLEKIGGAIELSSIRGQGTTFRIKIPLTLAILNALIVGVGSQSFAIPQIGVVELVRITDENRPLLESLHGSRFYRLRETLLPLVDLAGLLRLPSECAEPSLVVCQVGSQRFGIVVDTIYDTHEIVVKPMGRVVKSVPVYSGTTILGDGRVIMILDVPSIAMAAQVAEHADSANDQALDVAAAAEEEERVSLVLFRSGGDALQAVPLALVSRLEKISTQSIEWADGRYLVQYRGSLLPLVPASERIDMRSGVERPVIVFSDGQKNLGLAVEEICDIVEERLHVEMPSSDPAVLGTAVIAGRSTELLDVNTFLRSVDARWFGAQQRDEQRRRVLLVDDSPFFLNLVGPALRSSGFEVVLASDGQEALTRLEQGEDFDAIVSDIDMPRVDGFEFARRVSGHPRWGQIPLLALTGRDGQEDRAFALEMGFQEYLRKFDRVAVIQAIEAATQELHEEVNA